MNKSTTSKTQRLLTNQHPTTILQTPKQTVHCIIQHSRCNSIEKSNKKRFTISFYLHTLFPRQPQVASSKKTRDGVSCNTMYPSFASQLDHDRIDPRVTSLTLKINYMMLGQVVGLVDFYLRTIYAKFNVAVSRETNILKVHPKMIFSATMVVFKWSPFVKFKQTTSKLNFGICKSFFFKKKFEKI